MGQKPTWKDEQLIEAVSKCRSFTEVAFYLNKSKSTNTILRRRAIELNLDFSHFKISGYEPIPLSEVLNDSVKYSSHRLKNRLIAEGIKEYKCECCGITEWNGQPAPIELDHINGNHHDNRLENLRILCPNCHAQTDTYRSKNRKNKKTNKS
jgi:hypothetical protein